MNLKICLDSVIGIRHQAVVLCIFLVLEGRLWRVGESCCLLVKVFLLLLLFLLFCFV